MTEVFPLSAFAVAALFLSNSLIFFISAISRAAAVVWLFIYVPFIAFVYVV